MLRFAQSPESAPARRRRTRRRSGRIPALGFLLVLLATASSGADIGQEQRLRVGTRIFQQLLAAVERDEPSLPDQPLRVIVFHPDPDHQPMTVESVNRQIGFDSRGDSIRIGGRPLTIETTGDLGFDGSRGQPVAGIFIAGEPPPEELGHLIRYGIDHQTIVYSPFEGHVEEGVLAGLSVRSKIRPALNRATLEASRVRLKPLFVRICEMVEDSP